MSCISTCSLYLQNPSLRGPYFANSLFTLTKPKYFAHISQILYLLLQNPNILPVFHKFARCTYKTQIVSPAFHKFSIDTYKTQIVSPAFHKFSITLTKPKSFRLHLHEFSMDTYKTQIVLPAFLQPVNQTGKNFENLCLRFVICYQEMLFSIQKKA